MIATLLRQKIYEALVAEGFPVDGFSLEHPADLSHGDYSTNAALIAGKREGKDPREVAESLTARLRSYAPKDVADISVAGVGFINFTLSRDFFANSLARATALDTDANSPYVGKRIMVEYTQPNPFKPFHIGHLMSNTIGEAISRLLAYVGATVARANYQGDVGPHVAKAIWALTTHKEEVTDAEALGRAYTAGNAAYESDPKAKEEIDALNLDIYSRSRKDINALYDAGRRVSLEHFEEIYAKLGTKFDFYFFESDTGERGKGIVLSRPDIFEKSEGAVVFRGEKHGLHTRVFINSQGLPTYETKDVGLAKLKSETWKADTYLTVTASEQIDYFKVVKCAIEEVLPELGRKILHVAHGLLRLTTGKMSSRKGNVITGESLIADVEEISRAKMKETRADDPALATAVAVGAIKYSILRQSAGKDIIFDAEKSLSLEGDSGPYLMYAHARARSVIEKAVGAGMHADTRNPGKKIYELERFLYRFGEVALRAARELGPHYLTTYLTQIAGTFNSFYAKERIVDDKEFGPYKLALTESFAEVIRNGLWLLGIAAPERM